MARARKSTDDFLVDFNKAEESGGGGLRVPEGYYKVKIISAKVTKSKQKGTPALQLKLKIAEGKYKGKDLYENLWATPKTFSRLRDLLEAVGVEMKQKMQLSDMAEEVKGAVLYVLLEDDEPTDPKYKPRSTVAFSGGFISEEQFDEDGNVEADADEEDLDEDDDALEEDDEEDDEEGEESADEEDEAWTAEELTALPLAELREVATEFEVKAPAKLTAKSKVALIDKILEAQGAEDEEDEEEDADGEEGEESYTLDELIALPNADLKALATEYDIEPPARMGAPGKKKLAKQVFDAQEGVEDDEEDEEPEEEPEPAPRRRKAPAKKPAATKRKAKPADDEDDLDLDEFDLD
jgi:Protein of unknown function (DUF669)